MAQAVVTVGIDVAKAMLEVYLRTLGLRFSVSRDEAGVHELVARLREYPVGVVALEASGGYERLVRAQLEAAGFAVRLLNPLQVRRFAQAARRRAKNDRLDAQVIADYAALFPVEPAPHDPALARLAEHLLYRSQLLEAITAATNQREHFTDAKLRADLNRRIASLRSKVRLIERRLAELVAALPTQQGLAEILRSTPGVGPVLAWSLIGLLPELGRLGAKPIASLVGVAPFDNDSGQRRGQRHIQGGRSAIRTVLYMATLIAKRHNPAIAAFAERLKARGKKPKVVTVACMRKLLVILNAMARDQKPWSHANAIA